MEYVKIEDAHKCKGGFVIEFSKKPGYYIHVTDNLPQQEAQPSADKVVNVDDNDDDEVIWF